MEKISESAFYSSLAEREDQPHPRVDILRRQWPQIIRRLAHAVELRDFGKWFSEFAGMPILFELPHLDQTEVKARMYERGTDWVGGMFVYRAPVAEEVAA